MNRMKRRGFGRVGAWALMAGTALLAAFAQGETPDAYLHYVEARGEQSVDVGVVGRTGTKAEVSFRWTADRTGETCLLGARSTEGETAGRAEFVLSDSSSMDDAMKVAVGCGSAKQSPIFKDDWTTTAYRWEHDRDYVVTTEFAATNDGQTAASIAFKRAAAFNNPSAYAFPLDAFDGVVDTGLNIHLFAGNVDGEATCKAWARVYSVRVWQDGVLVRDMRPCLKDGRAGLHDAVSDAIFYSGTGVDLVYDASFNEPDYMVEYVDSDGMAYVDTEVRGRSGTSCAADMAWLKLNGDFAFLDARTAMNVNDRVFLLHSSQAGVEGQGGRVGLGYGNYRYVTDYAFFKVGERHFVETTLEPENQTIRIDGTTLYTANSAETYDTGRSLYLFANHVGDEALNRSRVRFYSLKIWQDGRLVRYFTPCVKYGRGALYDAVDGRIFFPVDGCLGAPPITKSGGPDRRLAWIASPGGTYLNTGVRARTGMRVEARMRWNRMRYHMPYLPDVDLASEASFLAACAADGGNRMYFIHSAPDTVWSGFGDSRIYPLDENGKKIGLVKGVDHEYEVAYTEDEQTLVMDGNTLVSTNGSAGVDAGCELYLFGCNHASALYYSSCARVYSLKIWQDDEPVRDFTPCLKDGRAGLYDAVSDQVFYPALPLPDSCIGPDVEAAALKPSRLVEYVETDGTQWLDTGVVGRSGVVAEFDMAWLDAAKNLDVGFIGSRSDASVDDTRFYLWHNAHARMSYGARWFSYVHATNPAQTPWWESADSVPVVPVQVHHVRADFAADRVKIDVDGVTRVDRTADFALDTKLNMYLFAENIAGKANWKSRARLYGLKIWQDGTLVRNFVPVRLGSAFGTVALWDKVSGTPFFLNDQAAYSFVGPTTGRYPSGLAVILR